MKHILRLITHLDYGGTEQTLISFTDNKDLLRHNYTFVALGHGGYTADVLKDRGFNVHIFNNNPSVYNFKNIFDLYRLIKKLKPDVIHTQISEANFHGLIAARLAGIPVKIAEEVGFPSHSRKGIAVFRHLYKNATHIICVSGAVEKHLTKLGELTKQNAIVIPNPVTMPKDFPRKFNDTFHWVYVGRISNIKNLKNLIHSFSALPKENRGHISLVGNGDQEKELKNLIHTLQLQEEISLLGFMDYPEEIVATADVLVLPSFSEGFGIAVAEAMLQAVPCLATSNGGVAEYIQHGVNGWLVNPFDKTDLYNKMNEILLKDRSEIQEIGLKAKKSIENKFSPSTYIKRLENLYENL